MNRAVRCLGPALAASATLLAATGCEDSAARQRENMQATITDAAGDLWQSSSVVTSPSGDEVEKARRDLERVVSTLGKAGEGDRRQQAVAALLAAQASSRLGAMSVAQANRIESAHRSTRSVVNGLIDTTVRLDLLAESLESMDVAQELATLDERRGQTEQMLQALSRQVAALDGPIDDQATANRDARAVTAGLREEAAKLRRAAGDLGDKDGFPLFEQAVEKDRAADAIDLEVAQREIDLRYALVPQHEVASTIVEHLQARLASIDDARASLQELAASSAAEAQRTRDESASLRQRIDAEMSALAASIEGVLKDLYARADSDFQRAASKARSATSGGADVVGAARLAAARAGQDQGDMNMQRARGLSDQAALLERLGASGSDEITAVRDEALNAARAAYQGARELLDQVNSKNASDSGLDHLKGNLDRALSGLPPGPGK